MSGWDDEKQPPVAAYRSALRPGYPPESSNESTRVEFEQWPMPNW